MISVIESENDHLDLIDKKLWKLTYHILLVFACPIIFRKKYGDMSLKIDYLVDFFVPKDSPRFDEIVDFLKQELREYDIPGRDTEKGYMMGTQVTIYKYHNLDLIWDNT